MDTECPVVMDAECPVAKQCSQTPVGSSKFSGSLNLTLRGRLTHECTCGLGCRHLRLPFAIISLLEPFFTKFHIV